MKYIINVLFILFSITVQSQTTQNVKGIVVDKDSDFPLMGAEIVVYANGQIFGNTADINGEYIIRQVPIGKISIKCSYIGYETRFIDNIFLDAGKELVVNFYLKEKISTLNQVVITAKKEKDQVAFVSTSNYKLDAKQINRYAGSLGDVSRMAMNYAGVNSNNDTYNSIIVRGNNPSSLLWTMEGVSIPNPNHYSAQGSSGGPVSMINTNLLGKSDFLAGAFPANFGNTTAAVFDLQFRKGNSDKYEFLGQMGFAGLEFGAEGPIIKGKKSSFLINYRYSTLEFFDKIGINLGIGTAVPKYYDMSFLFDIPTKKYGKFRIWNILGKSRIRFLTEQNKDNAGNYLDKEYSDLRTYNFTVISGINHKYFFNKKTSIYSSVSYSYLDQRVNLDTLTVSTNTYDHLYSDKIKTGYITLKSEVKSKRNSQNTFAVGVENITYDLDLFMKVTKQHIDYKNDIDEKTNLSGLYINYKHDFSDKFSLKSGLRSQYFSLNKEVSIEPRLGIDYHLSDKTKISFAYGLHSNIQSLLAYYSKHKIDNVLSYQNKKVKMTKAHHFILGINHQLADKLSVKTEVYYQYLFDVPVYHYGDKTYSIINAGFNDEGGTQVFYGKLFNDGLGKNYGLDLTLEQNLNKGFYLLFTGSLYNSLYKAYDNQWRHTAWDSDYTTSLLSGKEFYFSNKNTLSIDINFNYSGGRRYTPIDKEKSALAGEAVYDTTKVFTDKLPAYFRTDLKISYKKNGKHITQEWQLDLRNVFNRKNIFSQSYDKVSNEIKYTYQTGFLPVMQYRITF